MNRRRRKPRSDLLASHQKSWLWGRHAVLEVLRAGRWPIVELLLDERLAAPERADVVSLCPPSLAPAYVPRRRIEQLCHRRDTQGYLVRMGPYPYAEFDAVLKTAPARPWLILDRLQDPHNFGAIVRSAEVLGTAGVLVDERGQVGVTAAVARSSAGAVNHLPICRGDLLEMARRLKDRGIVLLEAVQAGEDAWAAPLEGPPALVVGSEARGVRTELAALCDRRIGIPQAGQLDSLNVATATGILLYELARRRAQAD